MSACCPFLCHVSPRHYVEEVTADALPPAGAKGYADLGLTPTKVDTIAVQVV
jgi:hypothetical protein